MTEGFQASLPRWLDTAWQAEALGWATAQLLGAGIRPTAAPVQEKARPWSTVFRIPTGAGLFWFKANAVGVGHEAALLAVLARRVPGQVLAPVAVDPTRHWLLMPDGGLTLRDVEGARTDLAAWERMLAEYAVLQRSLEPYVDELLAAGTPDGRPDRLPHTRAALLADRELVLLGRPGGLTDEQHRDLLAAAPAYARTCAELAALGVPSTLQHDDLHDHNVFAAAEPGGPLRVFDWGDSVVGHPFGTLLVSLRVVVVLTGLAAGAPGLLRLRDAYLEPWTDAFDRPTLHEACRLALRVGGVLRADCYRRALLEATPAGRAEFGDGVAGWLLETQQPSLLEPAGRPPATR